MKQLTLIDVANRLYDLAEVKGLTPNQAWLMFLLLQGWNRSGRRHSWEQSTASLCLKMNTNRNVLTRARNGLIQLGMVQYAKGNRGQMPVYSLTDVWNMPSYDTQMDGELCNESEHKPLHNPNTNRDTNRHYYKEKRREEKSTEKKEPEEELCPGETENPEPEISGSQLTTRVQGLRDHWSGPLTHLEQSALFQNRELFRDYPWELVTRWLKSDPDCPPNNRLRFLESGGVTEIGRAREWESESGSHHSPGSWKQKAATLCPQITGGQVVDRLQDARAERLTRLVAKGKMGLEEAQRTWKQG